MARKTSPPSSRSYREKSCRQNQHKEITHGIIVRLEQFNTLLFFFVHVVGRYKFTGGKKYTSMYFACVNDSKINTHLACMVRIGLEVGMNIVVCLGAQYFKWAEVFSLFTLLVCCTEDGGVMH